MKHLRKIRQMREWLLENAYTLNPNALSVAQTVVDDLANEWKTKQQEQYDRRAKVRDDQYAQLCGRAGDEAVTELEQFIAEMRANRISPEAAAGRLRDYMAEHQRLQDLYVRVMDEDAALEQRAAMEPEDFQEEVLGRFSFMVEMQPDMENLVVTKIAERQAAARAGQVALLAAQAPDGPAPTADEVARAVRETLAG